MQFANKLLSFFAIFHFTINPIQAQDQLGIVQDNYSPVNSGLLNPSLIVDQKPWIDINILGLGAYFRNNSIYGPDMYMLNPKSYPDFLARNPQELGYGYATANVLGPSFTMAIKTSSIGFHMAARGYAFFKNIPDETAPLINEFKDARVPDGTYFATNIRAKVLSWEEYGITYGQILYKRNKDIVQGAITVNRLLGVNATGIFISKGELNVLNDEGTLNNLDGQYWFNEPARSAGKGYSTSIGMTFKKMKKDISNYVPHSIYGSCVVAEYKHRLGFSLTDIGAIRFDELALYNQVDENTNIDSLENITDVTQEAIATAEGTSFTAWLPSALSVQYDYNLERGFYLNSMFTQRIAVPSWFGTERASNYSVSLRYETKVFTAALPFSVHEYEYTQLGLYFRIWSLAIGTDNLVPFLKKQDFYAADIYLYFKLPIFKHPACRKYKQKDQKNKGVMNKFLCPVW